MKETEYFEVDAGKGMVKCTAEEWMGATVSLQPEAKTRNGWQNNSRRIATGWQKDSNVWRKTNDLSF